MVRWPEAPELRRCALAVAVLHDLDVLPAIDGIVLPGTPLVARGPYRYLRHPNYVVVVLETAVVPLALGLSAVAAVFTLANAAMLYHRIRVENSALAHAGATSH